MKINISTYQKYHLNASQERFFGLEFTSKDPGWNRERTIE